MGDSDPDIDATLRRLKWPLRLTWLGMLSERVLRAFWPVWTLLTGMVAALAFQLHQLAGIEAVWITTVLWCLCLLWFLYAGIRRFHWPGRREAMERLDSTLPGRPLSALADHPALGADDAATAAIWRTHLKRMADRAANARAAEPDLRLASRDPYALRYVALGALLLALLFGSIRSVGETAFPAPPGLRLDAQASNSAWEGWIQPPAHTGRPSLYLNEVDRPTLSIPDGSRVTLRLYGENGVLTLAETVSGRDGPLEDPAAPSHDFTVTRAGRINVQGPGGRGWEITVVPDAPPQVRLSGEMTREARGTLRQEFVASDDYGVASGSARIDLDLPSVDRRFGLAAEPEPREPLILDLPMPIAGDRADFTEALIENLSQHPWANLPVTIRLSVEDGSGQTGRSAQQQVTLPGRRFFDPMAAALIEMRRDLLWSRETAPRAAQVLRAVSHRPEEAFRSERAFLLLRVALRQLEGGIALGLDADTRDEVAEALWEIALLVEEGDLGSARERLRRAQERLSEAMRNGADDSEIAELMQELREAMQDYMRQLAQEGAGEQDQQTAEGERMEITGDQLQALLDRIEELMQEGRMAEAMELMEQLNQMMENMQVTQGEGGQGGPGQQALEGLGETLRDQQGLSDDTFRDLQDRFGDERFGDQRGEQRGRGEGEGEGDGEAEGDAPGAGDNRRAETLAERQQALRDQLRGLEDLDLPGDGSAEGDAAREALDEAGRAMERAEEALREGDGAAALDRQAEAIDALREGMRGMAEALAQDQRDPGGDGTATAEGGSDNRRDPLGRDTGQLGRIGTDDDMLQGEDTYRRARDILDEIRRRSGEQDRPEIELDYLRRLLERF